MSAESKIVSRIKQYYPEIFLVSFAVILGIFYAWYVKFLGLTKVLVDQNSHLNLARQTIDSMTPGISQVGFWPPLLHVVMMPFTAIDYLYRTGLAGAVTLIPFLCIGTVFFYRLLLQFTKNKFLSFFGSLLFLLNPWILYYAVTPMMEILFIANLFAVGYFFLKWIDTNELRCLILSGLFISITSISRFEGILLVPLVGILVLIRSVIQRKRYREIEAVSIVYGIIASLGVSFIMLYGWAFGQNPLSFISSDWSAFAQQKDYFLPTEHNALVSFQYMLHTSYYMLNKYMVLMGIASFVLLLVLLRNFRLVATGLILVTPFIFDFLAAFRGDAIIYVPEFPPFGVFFNERYGLYWIGFNIFAIIVFIDYLLTKITIAREDKRLQWLIYFLTLLPLVVLNLHFLYETSYSQRFTTVKKSSQDYPTEYQIRVSNQLAKNYDYGKILITRALHDFVVVNAGVDLKNYIHESNFKYYDQALERPWLFARFVIMYSSENNDAGNWSKGNEKVSIRWGKSEIFEKYYVLIEKNEREVLYKVNEEAVRKYAESKGLDISQIPSLNASITWWDADTIYKKMSW